MDNSDIFSIRPGEVSDANGQLAQLADRVRRVLDAEALNLTVEPSARDEVSQRVASTLNDVHTSFTKASDRGLHADPGRGGERQDTHRQGRRSRRRPRGLALPERIAANRKRRAGHGFQQRGVGVAQHCPAGPRSHRRSGSRFGGSGRGRVGADCRRVCGRFGRLRQDARTAQSRLAGRGFRGGGAQT